jgi:hypothetical protein
MGLFFYQASVNQEFIIKRIIAGDGYKNDQYFILLDYEKRTKIYKSIELLKKTENWNLKFKIINKINELLTGNVYREFS